MEIVGYRFDAKEGTVYKVRCDMCTRKFEVPATFQFAKCPCGTHQRLLRLVEKLPEDRPEKEEGIKDTAPGL